jgi:response regulator of citrate/malate metabolism
MTEKEFEVFRAKWHARNIGYKGFGETHTAPKWAELFGISRTSMWRYMKQGLTVEQVAKLRGIKYPK